MLVLFSRLPDRIRDKPSGVFAIVDTPLSFQTVDGYLQFLRLCLKEIPPRRAVQAESWSRRLMKVSDMAACLRDSRTRFTGKSKTLFHSYCQRMAESFSKPLGLPFPAPSLLICPGADLVSKLETIQATHGWYYESKEELEASLADEMAQSLGGLSFPKPERNLDVSYYLRTSGYHEHIHDAVNLLLSASAYGVNCSSTRNGRDHGFDALELGSRLNYIKTIVEDIARLC